MHEVLRIIRFSLVVWIVGTLSLFSFHPAAAAPNARDCSGGNAAILTPQSGATVFGIVQIEGTASLGGEFQYYKLEVAPARTQGWGDLVGEARQQVVNGHLGVWDSAGVADGAYDLRLRVVDPTGNYCEIQVSNVIVQNAAPPTATAPPETPTPVETEAPPIQNAVPTPLPTTPSPDDNGTPAATETLVNAAPSRTPAPGSGGIGGIEIDQVIDAATEFFTALGRIFIFGVVAMAGVFFFVGVVYFVRRVL
jgi:hypothetical protein